MLDEFKDRAQILGDSQPKSAGYGFEEIQHTEAYYEKMKVDQKMEGSIS